MTGVDSGPLRRVALLAFVLVATAAATQLLTNALGADGLSVPEIGILPAVRPDVRLDLLCVRDRPGRLRRCIWSASPAARRAIG